MVLAALLLGCTEPGELPPVRGPGVVGVPSWVDDARHPQYPESRYLAAVGAADLDGSVSEARFQADERARQSIVLSLRAQVRSVIEVRAVATQDRADMSLDELTEIVGAATLDGSRVADRCEDAGRGVVYSLAVLDRHVAARNLAESIRETLAEADRILDEAAERPRAGRVEPLLRAYALYRRSRLERGIHRVLVGRDPGAESDRSQEARAALEVLFSDLRLEIDEGQGQDASPGAPLPAPVRVRVALEDGAPVPGVGVTLEPESPEKVLLSTRSARTGADGAIRFRVDRVLATGRSRERVRVALDVAETGLDAPATWLDFTLPTRETLDVLILLEETNVGRAVSPSTLGTRLGDRLRRAGFPIVDAAPLLAGVNAARVQQAGREELARLLGSRVDVVVRGRVESNGGGTVLGGLASAKARATLSGVDLRSGRVLAALQVGPRVEAHPQLDEAGRRAIRLLEDEVTRGIEERLESVLRGDE